MIMYKLINKENNQFITHCIETKTLSKTHRLQPKIISTNISDTDEEDIGRPNPVVVTGHSEVCFHMTLRNPPQVCSWHHEPYPRVELLPDFLNEYLLLIAQVP